VLCILPSQAPNHTNFKPAQEISYLGQHFDETLLSSYLNMKSQDLEVAHWWSVYQDVAKLVLPVDKFQKVLNCQGRFEEVKDELADVANGSLTGGRIFGHARAYAVGSTMARFINEGLQVLSGKEKLTAKDMGDFTDAALKEAANLSTSSALNMKREICVSYGGLDIKVLVCSFPEEPMCKAVHLSDETHQAIYELDLRHDPETL